MNIKTKIRNYLCKDWKAREVEISALFTIAFKNYKTTLVGCWSKTGQNRHLKLSPQRHILFYKFIFDKKESKPPKANISGRNYLSLSRHSFSSDLPF